MSDTVKSWSIEIVTTGPSGYIYYREGELSIPFYWEYGGGETVAIISGPSSSQWEKKYAWGLKRKVEIMQRVATETLKQRAPKCIVKYPNENSILVCENKLTK